jgi:t-SNARE complex subunit (syntaxin)
MNNRKTVYMAKHMIELGTISERVLAENELASLESDIHDIHDTFAIMRTMVEEQRPFLDTLESEIESLSTQTTMTVRELERANTYNAKASSRLLKLSIAGSILLSLPLVALAGVPTAIATTTIVGGGACILLKRRKLLKE